MKELSLIITALLAILLAQTRVAFAGKYLSADYVIDRKITFQIGSIWYEVNSVAKTMDTAPVILNGRTFVPATYLAEGLGGSIVWDDISGIVSIDLINAKTETLNIMLFPRDKYNYAIVNEDTKPIDPDNPDVVAYINEKGHTMIPVRFVAENLGAQVQWKDGESKFVTVFYPGENLYEEDFSEEKGTGVRFYLSHATCDWFVSQKNNLPIAGATLKGLSELAKFEGPEGIALNFLIGVGTAKAAASIDAIKEKDKGTGVYIDWYEDEDKLNLDTLVKYLAAGFIGPGAFKKTDLFTATEN